MASCLFLAIFHAGCGVAIWILALSKFSTAAKASITAVTGSLYLAVVPWLVAELLVWYTDSDT